MSEQNKPDHVLMELVWDLADYAIGNCDCGPNNYREYDGLCPACRFAHRVVAMAKEMKE